VNKFYGPPTLRRAFFKFIKTKLPVPSSNIKDTKLAKIK